MLAQCGQTTWLEDLMKTWEVRTVRQGGVLERSKDGQEVDQYLNGLEAEALQDQHEDEGVDGEDPSGEIAGATSQPLDHLNKSVTSITPTTNHKAEHMSEGKWVQTGFWPSTRARNSKICPLETGGTPIERRGRGLHLGEDGFEIRVVVVELRRGGSKPRMGLKGTL